jgi:PAS domain S-box-containing protein
VYVERRDSNEILDAIVAGLVVVGSDGLIGYWNAWMELAGSIPAERACGRSLKDVFASADVSLLERAAAAAIEAGASTLLTHALHPGLLPLKTRGGHVLNHDVMVSAVGEPPRRRCLIQIADVTIAARRERFLRERQNARYNALIASASDAILTIDSAGVLQLANPAALVHIGYTEAELVGRDAAMLFESRGAWDRVWQEVNARGTVSAAEVVVRRKDGSSRYFEVSASRWLDGPRVFVTAILRDISVRRDAEAALRRSEEQTREQARVLAELNEDLNRSSEALREASRRKDEFLATLAHELRNPLAPLQNGMFVMKFAANDPAKLERTRSMMERQIAQMVRLIDDLMDVSRISRDMIELHPQRTSIGEVLRQAVESSRPLIDSQQHRLTLQLPEEPIALDADVVRLVQVFANLLNNAAKYTPKGGHITVAAKRARERVDVRVADTGIGIPKEMLTNIFDMFMQVDHSLERSHGGLGIGLSLVRRLVQMHGGSVEAYSEGQGAGSEFIVRLPLAAEAAEPGRSGLDLGARGGAARRRILVVDDNQDAAVSLANALNILGHETRTAFDGASSLELGAEFGPEVVILDIGMPGLNGYETARRMRTQPWGKAVLLIALTGLGHGDDRRRSSEAGFDAHLVKPVELAALQELLEGAGAESA